LFFKILIINDFLSAAFDLCHAMIKWKDISGAGYLCARGYLTICLRSRKEDLGVATVLGDGLLNSPRLFVLLAILSVTAPAFAQQAPVEAPASIAVSPAAAQNNFAPSGYAKVHPALADFEKQGGLIDYLGKEGGVEGFVLVTKDQQIKTVYVTPEGSMVMGILVDRDGSNLTGKQLQAYRARLAGDQSATPGADKNSVSKAERVYGEVEKADWVGVGREGAPYAYMFMNVGCDHCQAFFRDMKPAIDAGRIQLRLLPFGNVPSNRDGGAALLSVDNPQAAWEAFMDGDTAALGADKIKEGALEMVANNTKLVATHKMQGPPFTLYRRPQDAQITAVVGRPKNPMLFMADLMPPEMPETGAAADEAPQDPPEEVPADKAEAPPEPEKAAP
jgi:thiol:disulfide interchange protein DsbG